MAILGIGEPESKTGLGRAQRAQAFGTERAHDGPLDQPVPPERLRDRSFHARRLQVDVGPGLRLCQELECLVEPREVGRQLRGRVGEDELAVELENVELD